MADIHAPGPLSIIKSSFRDHKGKTYSTRKPESMLAEEYPTSLELGAIPKVHDYGNHVLK
jgi:hypothetical protein